MGMLMLTLSKIVTGESYNSVLMKNKKLMIWVALERELNKKSALKNRI
jgi:hypothetical protein